MKTFRKPINRNFLHVIFKIYTPWVLLAALAFYHSLYRAEVYVAEHYPRQFVIDNPQQANPSNLEERKYYDERPDDFEDQEDDRENVVTYKVEKNHVNDQDSEFEDDLKKDLENHIQDDLGAEHKDDLDDSPEDDTQEDDPEDNIEDDLEDDAGDDTEDYYEDAPEYDLKDDLVDNPEDDLGDEQTDDLEDHLKNDLEDDNKDNLAEDYGDNLNDNLEVNIGTELEDKNKIYTDMYPSLKEMKKTVVDGSFDWSKTARSILFLKKHKCASSTLREALRNYLYWRGMTEEVSVFQALGGCYPSRWDPKCRPPTELESHVRNILYHHRLNLDEQLPRMFPDTKLITTVREPVSLLYRKLFTSIFF